MTGVPSHLTFLSCFGVPKGLFTPEISFRMICIPFPTYGLLGYAVARLIKRATAFSLALGSPLESR